MASPDTESLTLPVIGMTCAACQHHVESALRETAGVKSAHVDLMANRANVVFDPGEASAERLVQAIRGAGYDAVLPHPGAPTIPEPSYGNAEAKAAATLIAGAIAMLVAMPLGGQMGPLDHAMMQALPWLYQTPPATLRWALLIVTALLMTWAGKDIYIAAARALRHGATNMNTLVSLGTGVAFVYSAYATIMPGPDREVYFDAVLLILGFLLLGKALEARAKRRALAALDSLSRLRPATARRIIDGVRNARASRRNSHRRSRAGAARRALPGGCEDRRRPHHRGRIDAHRRIDTSAPGNGRSRTGRIAQLRRRGGVQSRIARRRHRTCADHPHGQQAQSSRAPMERLADRASAIFVPVVLVLAAHHVCRVVSDHRFSSDSLVHHRRGTGHRLSLRHGSGGSGCAHRSRGPGRAVGPALQGRGGAGAAGPSRTRLFSTRRELSRWVARCCRPFVRSRDTVRKTCCAWRRPSKSDPIIHWLMQSWMPHEHARSVGNLL